MTPTPITSIPVLAMPRSMEEAKAQLAEIKLKKSELSLAKKAVMEQMRQRRAEYTDAVRDRSTAGKGVGALISKDFGKTRRKAASVQNSYAREALARDLEPLEKQRADIEAAIAKLDQQKLQIDKWMADHKAAAKAAPKPAPAKMSKAVPASAAAETRTEAPAGSASTVSDERIASLKELASLKESGVLTEEEFQAEKKRILAGN
jgi:Short C-terminal domain